MNLPILGGIMGKTISNIENGFFIFKGDINVAADFPESAAVKLGWTYAIKANVTDNDPTKTNTGQSFETDDEIFWNGSNWTLIGTVVITDHGALDNLGDDDHTQYLLLAGRSGQIITDAITITGSLDVDNININGSVITIASLGLGQIRSQVSETTALVTMGRTSSDDRVVTRYVTAEDPKWSVGLESVGDDDFRFYSYTTENYPFVLRQSDGAAFMLPVYADTVSAATKVLSIDSAGQLGISTTSSPTFATITATTINAFSLGGKLTGGANEIEGSNFDINGGAIDAVTLGTNSPVTEAQIDNININEGNINIVSSGLTELRLESSANNASVYMDRGDATNYECAVRFLTGGDAKWLIGLDNTGDEDFYFYSYGTTNYPFTIHQSDGAIFMSEVYADTVSSTPKVLSINSDGQLGISATATPTFAAATIDNVNIDGNTVNATTGNLILSTTSVTANIELDPGATSGQSIIGGYLKTPDLPLFYARSAVAQNDVTGDGTVHKVQFATEILDQGGVWNTNTHEFTALVAGFYAFTLNLPISGLTSSHVNMIVRLFYDSDGGTDRPIILYRVNPWAVQAGTNHIITCYKEIEMAVGDKVYVDLNVGGGTKVVDIVGSDTLDITFSGRLITVT